MKHCSVFYAFVLLLLAVVACNSVPNSFQSPTTSPPFTLQQVPADTLVIENGTVIVGTEAAPIRDGIVVIQGDRIIAVGPRTDFAIPASTQVVDAWGNGFWDLIPFTLQMSLVIITGHVLATSAPMRKGIRAIAGWVYR